MLCIGVSKISASLAINSDDDPRSTGEVAAVRACEGIKWLGLEETRGELASDTPVSCREGLLQEPVRDFDAWLVDIEEEPDGD